MKGYPSYPSSAEYLDKVRELLDELPAQSDAFIDTLYDAFENERTIFLCGNGGSASTASHFGQDLAKGTLETMDEEKRFRVIALTDNVSFITALANDEGYETIFEQQLRNLARPGDGASRLRIGETGTSTPLQENSQTSLRSGMAPRFAGPDTSPPKDWTFGSR